MRLSFYVYSAETLCYLTSILKSPIIDHSYIFNTISQIVNDTRDIYSLIKDDNTKYKPIYEEARIFSSFRYPKTLATSKMSTDFTEDINGQFFSDHLEEYIERLVYEKDYGFVNHNENEILRMSKLVIDIQEIVGVMLWSNRNDKKFDERYDDLFCSDYSNFSHYFDIKHEEILSHLKQNKLNEDIIMKYLTQNDQLDQLDQLDRLDDLDKIIE